MIEPAVLHARSQALSQAMPALLADAERLASTVLMGGHGRRRSGVGSEFWQYRPAMPGDTARSIDWRRSARSDTQYVQEKEWQSAQSVLFWVDRGQSMDFASDKNGLTKIDRARLLTLALSILLVRGGERISLAGENLMLANGKEQLRRITDILCDSRQRQEYASPNLGRLTRNSRAIFLSDFLGDLGDLRKQVSLAADLGVKGVLLQILDPQEEIFPFHGRTIFQSMGRTTQHETQKASDLKDRYLARLAARKQELQDIAMQSGWQLHTHQTGQPAQAALLWLFAAVERGH